SMKPWRSNNAFEGGRAMKLRAVQRKRWPKVYMKSVSVLLSFSVCLAVVNGADADGAPFNLADLAFKRSWSSGSKDAAGKEMNATEIMYLVAHGGKLYAATRQWMESDPKTPKASSILVLDRPQGQWRVD